MLRTPFTSSLMLLFPLIIMFKLFPSFTESEKFSSISEKYSFFFTHMITTPRVKKPHVCLLLLLFLNISHQHVFFITLCLSFYKICHPFLTFPLKMPELVTIIAFHYCFINTLPATSTTSTSKIPTPS